MRTTVDIDDDLLKRLRREAHHRGIRFKHLLNRVLRQGLDAPPATAAEPFECQSFAMGQAARSINLDKAMRVADSLEDEEIVRQLEQRK